MSSGHSYRLPGGDHDGWVAYATYLERNLGLYAGASRSDAGWAMGLLQPIADGIKLLTKEDLIPNAVAGSFVAPYIAVVPPSSSWRSCRSVRLGRDYGCKHWPAFRPAVSSVGVLALSWPAVF